MSLVKRLRGLVTRAVIELVQDDLDEQGVQVRLISGDLLDDVRHAQPYGLTTHPPPDSDGIFLSVGGARGSGVVVCVGNREFRLRRLEQGEVALYSQHGQVLLLKADGSVELTANEIRLGAADATAPVALAPAVLTELQRLQAHFSAVEAVLTGPPIPEAGMGAPSALQLALGTAIGLTPYPSPEAPSAEKVRAV